MYKARLIYIEIASVKTKATQNKSRRSILPECSFRNDHQMSELAIVFPRLPLESYKKRKSAWLEMRWRDASLNRNIWTFGPKFCLLRVGGREWRELREKYIYILNSQTRESHSVGKPLIFREALLSADKCHMGNVKTAGSQSSHSCEATFGSQSHLSSPRSGDQKEGWTQAEVAHRRGVSYGRPPVAYEEPPLTNP